jgi:hypothetical protein
MQGSYLISHPLLRTLKSGSIAQLVYTQLLFYILPESQITGIGNK